ncbi:MAG: ABC transporter ATP-binding protein [Phaeodactylibacter sp.]|nr:ABC transporter ATP-binding protein [Phaeodactylibacter sp.]
MITIEKLKKSFGSQEVLKGINLEFQRPGITAILGPNGSGKTTLIKSILGMVLPDKGRIRVGGEDVKGGWAYRRQIDYLPQIARFPENLTVQELIRMIRDLRGGRPDAEHLIRRFGLGPFLGKRLGNLSGGTRQKANIVLALMYDSPVLILDEPTSGLDPVAMLRLKELLRQEKEKGKHIIVTTHIMGFVEEMADEVVFLLEGHIHFQGGLQELKEKYGANSLELAIARILQQEELGFKANGHGEKAAALVLKAL